MLNAEIAADSLENDLFEHPTLVACTVSLHAQEPERSLLLDSLLVIYVVLDTPYSL